VIGICAGLFLATGWAQSELRPPPPFIRILIDEVGALTDAQGNELSKSLQELHESTRVLVVMVITGTTAPQPVEDYVEYLAHQLAHEGAFDPARSVFVIVALNDRALQILPGRALRLDESLTGKGITRDLVPLLRERRYFEALMRLTVRLREIIENRPESDRRI
jgi:uncharacterized membrane protein YgcG